MSKTEETEEIEAPERTLGEEIEAAERTVEWVAWPGQRVYGPGLSCSEVSVRHDRYLRSGWCRESGDAYHRIRLAPLTIPLSAAWREAYPSWTPAVDPWLRQTGEEG